MGFRSTLRRRRQSILAVLTAMAVFGMILFLWIGHSPSDSGGPDVPDSAGSGAASISSALSDSALPSASSEVGSTSPPGRSGANIPPGSTLSLPPFSSDINSAGEPTHIVHMSVTSDKTILQLAFAARDGKPASGYHTYVDSPSTINTVARGDGIVAELAAQASPGAKSITCSISVDGVTTSHTAVGPFAVVLCLA
jgi:hypothetical protein